MIREKNVQNFIQFHGYGPKKIKLHEYHFSTNFTQLLYALVVKISIQQNSLSVR
jgi:hypothetical protein